MITVLCLFFISSGTFSLSGIFSNKLSFLIPPLSGFNSFWLQNFLPPEPFSAPFIPPVALVFGVDGKNGKISSFSGAARF